LCQLLRRDHHRYQANDVGDDESGEETSVHRRHGFDVNIRIHCTLFLAFSQEYGTSDFYEKGVQ
jgi:hypothetical protein